MTILRAILGLLFFVGVAWLLSSARRRFNLRLVLGGLLIQVLLALVILKTDPGRELLDHFSQGVAKFLSFSHQGGEFVFGPLTHFAYSPPGEDGEPRPLAFYAPWDTSEDMVNGWPIVFAFRALVTIVFFSAVMAILYHLGIMQVVIWLLARLMTWFMRVSGAESLAMAANIFVGQTEAPLVVRPYIDRMTSSELMALMTGGFATIAGSVLAAYIGMLGSDYAGHLLAASFMSAPAAFIMAKVMVPETEESVTAGRVELRIERQATNLLEAAATGTTDGLRLALNVAAMLIAFVGIIALINWPLGQLVVDGKPLSLQTLFGWIFAPVAWAMGIPWGECGQVGALLGIKIGVNEFVAFAELAKVKAEAALSPRSGIMAAYALCGFANFASIGIQIGGIGALAPGRRQDLSRLALRAMLGGAFASWMTATIAGAFIDV